MADQKVVRKVILCIDDDQDFLEALRVILESGGYEIVEARSAEEGLRAYRHKTPDLILVDLMMEEIDAGTRFVREVKADGGHIPMYMLSSVGDDLSMTADYSALGLSGVLQKPVDPPNLLAILKAKLG